MTDLQRGWNGRDESEGTNTAMVVGGITFIAVGVCMLLTDARVRNYLRGLDVPGLVSVASPAAARYLRVGRA